jgi:hypothetical protein
MRKIPLTKGKFATVDNVDYHKVIGYKWKALFKGRGTNRWYAYTYMEAACAYDTAAIKYHKEFARLNFPR